MENGKIVTVNKSEERKIILCFSCEGKGYKEVRTSSYDTEFVDCDICAGKGRLLKTITTTIQQLQ